MDTIDDIVYLLSAVAIFLQKWDTVYFHCLSQTILVPIHILPNTFLDYKYIHFPLNIKIFSWFLFSLFILFVLYS